MQSKLLLALFLSTTTLWGFELKVSGRNYTLSCQHFTSVQGDVLLNFTDTSLPWGSEVAFVTGWEGREGFPERRFDWTEREEWFATATAPYTWTLKLSKVLHERSHAHFKDTLNFAVKVISPGRTPYYLNGGSSWGFFKTRLVNQTPGRCVSGLDDLPEFKELIIETIRRD